MDKNSEQVQVPQEQPVKRKRGRPRTKQLPDENAPPKKRGRKPKPKDETAPKKVKRKFNKTLWKASDFTLSIMTRDSSPEREEVVLEVPINSEQVENPESLLSDNENNIDTVTDTNDRHIKRFKPDETIEKKTCIEDLIEERNDDDEEIERRLENTMERLPESLFLKKPKKPISPPLYNPEIDIGGGINHLKLVTSFNDDVVLSDSDIDDKEIQFTDIRLSESSSSENSTSENDSSEEEFNLRIEKRRKPGESRIDVSKIKPIFQTSAPDHIPYSSNLINSGINHKEIYSVLPQIYNFTDGKDVNWPERTNIHCWWDCHSFDTVPIPAPMECNRTLKKFKVRGCFCSFNCALAFVASTERAQDTSLVNYFYTRWIGKRVNIRKAPPREALDIFGGPMTIDEFRKSFTSMTRIELVKPPLIPQTEKIEFSFIRPLINKKTTGEIKDENNNLEDVSKIIPATKLARKKSIRKGKASISSQFQKIK